MRRLLFLDIDGVLNTFDYVKSGKGYIDPEKIKLLNYLKGNDIEVVISSSWGYREDTLKALKDLELNIVGGIDDEGYFPDWVCRGNLIEKWICDNVRSEGFKYAILDDSRDMLICQENSLVLVDGSVGIIKDNIEEIKKILKI